MLKCDKCGTTAREGAFCSECGGALRAVQAPPLQNQPLQTQAQVAPGQDKYAAYGKPAGQAAAPQAGQYAAYTPPPQQQSYPPAYQQPQQSYGYGYNGQPYGPVGKDGVAPVLSIWMYIGAMLLFTVPLIGFIFMIIWSFGGHSNKNLVNFARANLFFILFGIALTALLLLAGAFSLSMIFGQQAAYSGNYFGSAAPLLGFFAAL